MLSYVFFFFYFFQILTSVLSFLACATMGFVVTLLVVLPVNVLKA